MATWMNEWDVEESAGTYGTHTPNLQKGSQVLLELMRWTNRNSDGWPYWQKPIRAADKLMGALQAERTAYRRTHETVDLTDAELKKLLTPIKSFLTRQGVAHSEVGL